MNIEKAIEALTDILKIAREHPSFYEEAFDKHDINALVREGGDVCDWTIIAIIAADALKT